MTDDDKIIHHLLIFKYLVRCIKLIMTPKNIDGEITFNNVKERLLSKTTDAKEPREAKCFLQAGNISRRNY